MKNSFHCQGTLTVGQQSWQIFRLKELPSHFAVDRLPFVYKIILENLLRHEDGVNVTAEGIRRFASQTWAKDEVISFMPSRVLLQDFTGVPVLVDLAAMRAALFALGGDPERINPQIPVELVIDHSIQVDNFGTTRALEANNTLEMQRNRERYTFLRWGQNQFTNMRIVPPSSGIVHQVNLEYLARVVFTTNKETASWAYPDTLVGTDSHTTMINGLGVLGWGVGGIEAESAMLGEPITMTIPQVVGFGLHGSLPEGVTATDLVLTITQILRQKGVVGQLVEFYGDGLDELSLADRATIANMSPEFGATCAYFPIDQETIRYLELTGRSAEHMAIVSAYAQEQGLFRTPDLPVPHYNDHVSLNLATVEPSLAGPRRPQDRLSLATVKQACHTYLEQNGRQGEPVSLTFPEDKTYILQDSSVVIAAITSCTNTSNPAVMLGAGLLAKKALERGLQVPPYVKTSLAPGSKVVIDYLMRAGLLEPLTALGFHLVGFGCTTCIGNSGPLPPAVHQAIQQSNLSVSAVLSGNRNFEGRIHPDVQMSYLASPALVVAFALAGRMDINLAQDPIGYDGQGEAVFLHHIWPSTAEIKQFMATSINPAMFVDNYKTIFAGDAQWQALPVPEENRFTWQEESTYLRLPPYFANITPQLPPLPNLNGLRTLIFLGNSITTDHISPAGDIPPQTPAGLYLSQHGVPPENFNSYGSRRGNHEVMMRGTFANTRIKNLLVPAISGGWTQHFPSGEMMSVYEAAMRYQAEGVPLLVLAGKEYGSGSSRDWAAKGAALLGVKVVLAESFERIHRSNLVGMGILPLQFKAGENATTWNLTGKEWFDIEPLSQHRPHQLTITAHLPPNAIQLRVIVRIDTDREWEYYCHGGILPFALRKMLATI